MLKSVISVLALISVTSAVLEPGVCPPKPPTISEFDQERYLGDWYAYATVPGFFQPEGVSCQRAQYGLLPNGTVSVYNVQTTAAGELDDICGYALQEDPALPGELCVYFVQGEVTFPGCGLYWILDTDYENYASVYSCVDGDILGVRSVFAWLLTREQIPSQETLDLGMDAFMRNGLEIDWDILVQGDTCSYDPPSPNCSDEIPTNV